MNLWRPEVLLVGEPEGRRAGELLGIVGGNDSMDALLVAVADLHTISEIFTTDPNDVERFCNARGARSRRIAVVNAQ